MEKGKSLERFYLLKKKKSLAKRLKINQKTKKYIY